MFTMESPGDLEEYARQAHQLVDTVIENAISRLQDEGLYNNQSQDSIHFDLSRDVTITYAEPKYETYEVKNIDWLTIEEFSVEKAEQKIHEFIKTWDYQDCWLDCVDYLGHEEHDFDIRYRYRVLWSIPTRRKPVPRSTAAVYFTFEVSKIKPKNFPVEVYYVFETNKLVHRPGHSRFREQWLKDIIENKVRVLKMISF